MEYVTPCCKAVIEQFIQSLQSNDSNSSTNQDTSSNDELNQITLSSLVELSIEKCKIQRFLNSIIHEKTLLYIRSNWSPRDVNRLNSCCDEGAISFHHNSNTT